MKEIILAAVLVLAACTGDDTYAKEWAYACEQVENLELGYTCDGLDAPKIIRSDITVIAGANGIYMPDDKYIFVRLGAGRTGTILHEMVHYIIWNNDKEVGTCEHERIARFVGSQPWDDGRKKQYGCPVG